jgi:tRNA modification GTPase
MSRSAKKVYSGDDTIVAIITPPGEGGIAGVRLAGPLSKQIALKHFRPKHDDHGDLSPFMLRYGLFYSNTNQILDEVMAVFMPERQSYTGLDQIEIFCHGGLHIVRVILDELIKSGARPAEPGEFTKLAFLNGRIDLAKAEAVAEIIAANTSHSFEISKEHLLGAYTEHISTLRESLISIIADLEAAIDFPEDDIQQSNQNDLSEKLSIIEKQLTNLESTYNGGRLVKEGFRIVIGGRPNAGKSSLFNLLLKHERALVNPTPGTTRDYLSEWIDISGYPVNLIDTAGIRDQGSHVEKLGQTRAKELFHQCDLIIWIVDLTQKDWQKNLESDLRKINQYHKIIVGNKIDTLKTVKSKTISKQKCDVLISCKTKIGLKKFEDVLTKRIVAELPDLTSGLVVTSARHKKKLSEASKYIHQTKRKLLSGESLELLTFDIHQAIHALDEITGKVYTEHILEQIFARFCIGK